MSKTKVLVTGSNGQLGQCLNEISNAYNFTLYFASSKDLDITSSQTVKTFFKENEFDYCINCAAYTAVDRAEEDTLNAEKVNTLGAKNLAEACLLSNTALIHISTDFVFDGLNHKPYIETDKTNPVSVYGSSKLKGEEYISSILKQHFIIRTSWLYSEYGNNFVKTMLKLSKEREELGIINDQIGTPTYAKDLAAAVFTIINENNSKYGIYHYSNEGVASWYDFAKAIFEISNTKIKLKPIPTSSYPTPAKRPHYSVLDKSKAKTNLNIEIPYWRDSLKDCLKQL